MNISMKKQYEYREVEDRLRRHWDSNKIYQIDATGGDIITIDTPPPTVSGSLHIGHIFSYTQTDIIARYLRLTGKSVWYPFGFDDNGLPTERFIEKKRNISAQAMSRSSFIQLCLTETAEVERAFRSLWERMGLSVDWNASYTTIGTTARTLSQASFIRLYEQGFIYRKNEPALYCTSCRTTVAQAELDDHEEATTLYSIPFTDGQGQQALVATSRPELLPACVAVLYHPEDSRYTHLKGTVLTVPLFGHQVPVYADTNVIPEKGTGLVMCCTFGDTMDIHWYKAHNLPYRQIIGTDGKWTQATGALAGKNARSARETVISLLEAEHLIMAKQSVNHSINVHERCKQPIEFLVIPQWFIRVLPYKQELIAAADTINWYPSFMKTRYINWVENITWDWCISRQRFFGIPFPVWHCTSCNEILMASPNQLPIDPQETAWEGSCTQCGGGPVVGDTDVMDTWNTSSITPYICEALRTESIDVFDHSFEPMALRPQAHDIIRTWAFYTIAKSWMHHRTVPWKNIVISGHVLSASGDKLSKSKNNSLMDPETLLAQYPADVIRFWTASGCLGHDVAFSEQQLKIGNRLITKLWNAFTFIADRVERDYRDKIAPHHTPQQTVHRWMQSQLASCYAQYQNYFNRYEFSLALQAVESCFWHDFCDNYLELTKDQFFNPERYTPETISETKQMLARFGLQILQLYAPFLPYITEEIYHNLYSATSHKASLHTTLFNSIQTAYTDSHALKSMDIILGIIRNVRRLKTAQQLSLRTEIALLHITGSAQDLDTIKHETALIKGATRSHLIEYSETTEGAGDGSLTLTNDQWHAHVTAGTA